MTKPQIWIATFLTLFIVLFLLQKLTENKKTLQKPNILIKSESQKAETPEILIA